MIIYNKYLDNQDYTWYDSTNVLFSKCYDNANSNNKTLKVVFKTGKTYVYRDVDINDYLSFKTAESTGKSFDKHIIKKYKGFRIADVQLEKLEQLKENFIKETDNSADTQLKDLTYKIEYNEKNGEFILKMYDKIIYHGKENKVSLFSLLKSMNINYSLELIDNISYQSDEHDNEIKEGK